MTMPIYSLAVDIMESGGSTDPQSTLYYLLVFEEL